MSALCGQRPSRAIRRAGALLPLFALSSALSVCLAGEPGAATIAANGQASYAIQVSTGTSPRNQELAATLAGYLRRISGATFEVKSVDGKLDPTAAGIQLGVAADFAPGSPLKPTSDPDHQEDYLLQTRTDGVTILGVGEDGLQDAVWDFLHRLGYRHFFSNPHWEFVPRSPHLTVNLNVREHPVYLSRRIWYGYGPLPENRSMYAAWCAHNRLLEGVKLSTGHAYGQIVRRNREEFAKHPEYLALVDGQRQTGGNAKFCISNVALRELVVQDALRQLAADPTLQSISLEPSDGGGWCECPDCAKMGSVTDRVVTLANQVAVALAPQYPNTYVGIYAYNEHSPPPTIKVHPRVVPSIATSFIRGGYTLDQLLAGWSKQAANLGIREYYSVHPWDRDMPGQARGSNPEYLGTTIAHFAGFGAKFLSAESSANFGCNGLGYYLAARYMWNPAEAKNQSALVDDFLTKSFGAAKEPMRRWYALADGGNRPLISRDLLGRLFRELATAWKLAEDDDVKARLTDLILYTHSADLYQKYSNATGAQKQAAFEAVLRFNYRIRQLELTHTVGFWRDLARRDRSVKIPAGAEWSVPEPKNPWKSSAPFTEAEVQQFVEEGIKNNPLLQFTPVAFSNDLVPAGDLKPDPVPPGEFDLTRGENHFYTWTEKVPSELRLKGTAGLVYDNRGDAKITVYPSAQTEGLSTSQSLIPADKALHDVTLKFSLGGLQRLELQDASSGTKLSWPQGSPVVLESSLDHPARFASRWNLYFYVPRGTKIVGGFSNGGGNLLDNDGKVVMTFTQTGYWSVPVAPGQDGKLWKFSNCNGQRMLMTVPPYLARAAGELLLPREVVEADRKR